MSPARFLIGIWILAAGMMTCGWLWSLMDPLVMFVFLRWVSGIPLTDAQALRTRGEAYRDYQARTSMLFPWPLRQR